MVAAIAERVVWCRRWLGFRECRAVPTPVRGRPQTKLPVVAVLLVGMAFPFAGSAHRLDECLQATLAAIEPGGIRLMVNLTPGAEVAEQVIALVDPNRDGVISSDEAAAYAEQMKRDLTVRLGDRDFVLDTTGTTFPAIEELRTGIGIIQVEFRVQMSEIPEGAHRLTFENRHLPSVSVYLINAALPKSKAVQITRQKRNNTQSFGEIDFVIRPPEP